MKYSLCILALSFGVGVSAVNASEKATVDFVLERASPTPTQVTESDMSGDHILDVVDLVHRLRSFPVASFVKSSLDGMEDMSPLVAGVSLKYPFTGTINYSLTDFGADTTSNLSVQVNGATAVNIPVSIGDDAVVSASARILGLSLNTGTGYDLGAATTALLVIKDDDAIWDGSLVCEGLTIPFQLELGHSSAGWQARMPSDGVGLIPVSPVGVSGWSPVSLDMNTNRFEVQFGPLTVERSQFGDLGSVTLTIRLVAEPGADASHRLDLTRVISGALIETLAAQGHSHLNRTLQGTFTLVRRETPIDWELVSSTP